MSSEEKTEMLSLLNLWDIAMCRERAKYISLTEEERELLARGEKVPAIKQIRDRTGERLMVCKLAADLFLKTTVR